MSIEKPKYSHITKIPWPTKIAKEDLDKIVNYQEGGMSLCSGVSSAIVNEADILLPSE